MSDGFKAKEIGLRAQKKILGRMAGKNMAKVLIDETAGSLLDNVYRLLKAYTGNKKEAEKTVKNAIKLVIKLGILSRNSQFDADELRCATRLRERFRSTAMAVVSFYEVDFSYDRAYMSSALQECQSLLHRLVDRHLTQKSLARIDSLFGLLARPEFLDAVFRADSSLREHLARVVADLNKAFEEGGM